MANIFKKNQATTSSPFGKPPGSNSIFGAKQPFTTDQKPSATSGTSIFSKSMNPSPSKTLFQKKEEGQATKTGPFQSNSSFPGHHSSFKPTSPFQSFTPPDHSTAHYESEPKAPTMKPLSPEVVRSLRTNLEIVKEILKDHKSHLPVNNETMNVLIKRLDNLYQIESEEGKDSPFLRQNNGAYLSDGTLVNSIVRDWIKGFEHSHKLQKFTTLRHFDRYLFAEDFLIPNREQLIKAIQLKNELGSEDTVISLQTQLHEKHSVSFHKYLMSELKALHQALFILRKEGSVLQKFKFVEYMKCVREVSTHLRENMMKFINPDDALEYQLTSLIEALQLTHWLIPLNPNTLQDAFTLNELIPLLQLPFYITAHQVDRIVKSAYYWTILLILQILRFSKKGDNTEEIITVLSGTREQSRLNRPCCKKFLMGVFEVVIGKSSPKNPLRSLDYWDEPRRMLQFLYEEQNDSSTFVPTLIHWVKEIDKFAPLSYLCQQKQQNHFLAFLSQFCSLFPEVTEKLQGLHVTDDLMEHFPVNFAECIYFLSFMSDYSFVRGGEPTSDSAHRVKKLFIKFQNMKLLHLQMNEEKFREAFGEEGLRSLGKGYKEITLTKNMIFSQVMVETHIKAVLESANNDSIYVLFQKQYSAWRVLLQMCNVWCKKLNNPIVERKIIIQDTKLVAVLLRALAGFTFHQPHIIGMLSQELRNLDPEQYEDELDHYILFSFLMKIAYSGCQFLPDESEELVAGVLSIILQMLRDAPLETICLIYQELSTGDLNLLHLICNANLHKEHKFLSTLQILAITEELLHPSLIYHSECDTRYGEVLLWFLEAGLMRMVCSIQSAKLDHLEDYFQIYTSCLTLIGRIADLCCVNPLRYPLVLYEAEYSSVAKEGSSLASNLIQILDSIPVIDFIQKVLDFVPVSQKQSTEAYESNILKSIKYFKLDAPIWRARLAEAQSEALFALNRLLDLGISALLLKYPKHQEMQQKIQKYLLSMGQLITVYTGVPCLTSQTIQELLNALRLIRPRSATIKRDQPLLPLPLDIIQFIGSSYKLDHPDCAQPHFEEIERESVLCLSKILLIWELSDLDGEHQLTTLYPGSLKQSAQEAKMLVKKLTLIPQSPFSYLNTVQAVVQIFNITSKTQPQFFKLVIAEPSFLELLIESSVKELAPIQHSYTCFCLISSLLKSEMEVNIASREQSMKDYTTSICLKIQFFQKLLNRLSLKYSAIINEHDFVSELDRMASDRPDRYKVSLHQDNFALLIKCKIVQIIIFELLEFAVENRIIKRTKVAAILQKAPLAADLQTSYLELARSINAANFIQKSLKMLGDSPPVQLFEAAIKHSFSPLAYQVYLQINTTITPANTGEVLNALSYPLFFSTEPTSTQSMNQLIFQGFDSIPFKYGCNFLYDVSELIAQYAENIGRVQRDLQKATIIFHANNYVMSLISIQGSLLTRFHSLCKTAFRLVPEKEVLAFSRLNQSQSFKLLGSILDTKREVEQKEEDYRELKYSSLFNHKYLNYFQSLIQGSWGSLCEEIRVPQLSRLYSFGQRTQHHTWLLHKNSQLIMIDANRYWRKNYPRFCQEHKSTQNLCKQLRSYFNSFTESIWTPLDELHKDFIQNRESTELSLFIASTISNLLSTLFKITNHHNLYQKVITDKPLFQRITSCIANYFNKFSYFYEPCLNLARNSILLLSAEQGEFQNQVKTLFSTSLFKFLNNSRQGRPSEIDQLCDELNLLHLYYREMGTKAQSCFASDIVQLFLSSNFISVIEKAALHSKETECMILLFEILSLIFTSKVLAQQFERDTIALLHTYSPQILRILKLFDTHRQQEEVKDGSETFHFSVKNLQMTHRIVKALASILQFKDISGIGTFWQNLLQPRVSRGLCDALILGCLSLFSTRVSLEKSYMPQNPLELELQKKSFKSDKHNSQHLIKLREFTNGTIQYSHLQDYNPNFYIVLVERLLHLIGREVTDMLNSLLIQERGKISRAMGYFTQLWCRDDVLELERGELGMIALDRLEDLVIFYKYLLLKSVAWENEIKEAFEELRAVAIVDDEVQGYTKESLQILQSLDLYFQKERVSGGLKKSMQLLDTLLKTGREEITASYGQNRHINEAFNATEENQSKCRALLEFTKLD